MSVLIVGAPEPVDFSSRVSPWTSCVHRWTSGGETWDLTTGESGVVLLAGVRGITMPPVIHYRRKSASVPGSIWRGSTTDERPVFWPVEVAHGDGSQAWIDHNRRFRRTLHPDRTGVWSITQPGDGNSAGETRYLRLRYNDESDYAEDIASELLGFTDYGLNLVAEQPYWEGRPERQRWVAEVPVNYYGGGPVGSPGFGPPYVTSSSVSLASAVFTNPGDVPGLMRWTVFGPCTNATMGVGTKKITVPFALNAGEWLRIDTARTDRRALVGTGPVIPGTGVNRTRSLGADTKFGEIPPGESVPLSISLGGFGGAIEAELVPLYYEGR